MADGGVRAHLARYCGFVAIHPKAQAATAFLFYLLAYTVVIMGA